MKKVVKNYIAQGEVASVRRAVSGMRHTTPSAAVVPPLRLLGALAWAGGVGLLALTVCALALMMQNKDRPQARPLYMSRLMLSQDSVPSEVVDILAARGALPPAPSLPPSPPPRLDMPSSLSAPGSEAQPSKKHKHFGNGWRPANGGRDWVRGEEVQCESNDIKCARERVQRLLAASKRHKKRNALYRARLLEQRYRNEEKRREQGLPDT